MPRYKDVSVSVIRRLPKYYRFLEDLLAKGVHRISSRELADRMKLTASQIRQDLNCFGGFGQQGYGYNVDALHKEIAKILGLDSGLRTVLVGAGNLGLALVKGMNFPSKGFNLIGIFDSNPEMLGTEVRGVTISHVDDLESFCAANKPEVAILCVPKDAAREVTQRLINGGVRGYWNFSHIDLGLYYPDIAVENVHLSDSLMTLCYQVNELKSDPLPPTDEA